MIREEVVIILWFLFDFMDVLVKMLFFSFVIDGDKVYFGGMWGGMF